MKTMLQLYEFIALFDKLLLFMKFGTANLLGKKNK